MRDQLSIAELDQAIEQKHAEIEQLTDVRASLLDAISALDDLSNGTAPAPTKTNKRKNGNKNGDGPDYFKDTSDDELKADAIKLLQESSDCNTIRKMVTVMTGGDYSDASKKRLHGIMKNVEEIKIGRGGGLSLVEVETADLKEKISAFYPDEEPDDSEPI